MRRPLVLIPLVALGVVAFLAISFALARVFSANSAERAAIEALVVAQARGDGDRVAALIDGCRARPDCVAAARANAVRLRSRGAVQIVRLDPSTNFALGTADGVARVVWRTPSRLTVVQCVRVRRGGDLVHGLTVALRSLSRPIPRESSCPSAG